MDPEICKVAETGDLEGVKALVERGADINSKTWFYRKTPLHHAAEKGYLEIVKFLVESGADKEAKQKNNNLTPLHFAAAKCHLEIVKFLVERGADKEAKDFEGQTSFQLAEKSGEPSIVDYLKTVESSKRERFLFSF